MSFLLRYLTVGVIGTLGVYYGTPFLKPILPPLAPAPIGQPAAEPAAVRDDEQDVASKPRPPDAVFTPPTALPEIQPSTTDFSTPDEPTLPPTTDSAAPDESPRPPPADASVRESVQTSIAGYTPATQMIPSSGPDITHWGVTLVDALVYERDGKRRDETLPGGTLVEQAAATTSSRGEMALCRVWRGSRWSGPYLIATADLIRFEGGRTEVAAEDFDLLARYAALNARIDARTKELQRLAVDANPHAAPLRKLKQDYDHAAKLAKALTQERDSAQGNSRIDAGEKLRKLKEDEGKMRRQLETLTRQYEAWKQRYATTAIAPERDAQVQALTAQMEALRPKLGNFGL